jgi:hypothetical protein
MNRRLFIFLFVLLLLALSTGAAAAQNSYSLWFINFWDNEDLEGIPVATASTGVIDHHWGGSPAGGVPSDNWSAQWTSYVYFSPGTYRITTQNDDGVRVFLGDKHVIVDWNKHGVVTNEATVSLVGGTYSMAVDFFDDYGSAVLVVGWQRIGPPISGVPDVTIVSNQQTQPPPPPSSQTAWQAHYWNNTNMSGAPALARYESAVNYDWGWGSPAPGIVATDNFSARWSRSVYFNAGTYQFTTQSDDGIRVYIDGHLIIDNWTVHAQQTNIADVTLESGSHSLVVEYFEQSRLAVAKFWW